MGDEPCNTPIIFTITVQQSDAIKMNLMPVVELLEKLLFRHSEAETLTPEESFPGVSSEFFSVSSISFESATSPQ